MNLYRLDHDAGQLVHPVKYAIGRHGLPRQYRATLQRANRAAVESDTDVVVSRISCDGHMRPVVRLSPSGAHRRIK
jgi:hypothetical protein